MNATAAVVPKYVIVFLENGGTGSERVAFRSTSEKMLEVFGIYQDIWPPGADSKEKLKQMLEKAKNNPSIGIMVGGERPVFRKEKEELWTSGSFMIQVS